ncbi:MAG: hypothetical protein ACI9JM_000859 [Halioglobus sp.]|jgi:hypothetical protein
MNVITGMHRSGTSFLANLVHEAGADFGPREKLLEADSFNAGGYFENTDVMVLNDRIVLGDFLYSEEARLMPLDQKGKLILRARMAVLKARYLLLNDNTSIERRARKKSAEMQALDALRADIWVKDPRFSLTLQEWMSNTTIEKVLYIYRHPAEVAHSLKEREHLPLWLGLRTWEYHVRVFLSMYPAQKTVFLDYNQFRNADTAETEVARCFEAVSTSDNLESVLSKFHSVYRPELVHQKTFSLSGAMYEKCMELYKTLQDLHDQ